MNSKSSSPAEVMPGAPSRQRDRTERERVASADPYDAAALFPSVLETAAGLIAADAYAIWLLDLPRNEWYIAAGRGLSDTYRSSVLPGQLQAMPPDPICAEDVSTSPLLHFRSEMYSREGIHSLMAVPLSIRDQRRGTLVFYFRQPHRFSETETRQASSLASLASSALATTELYHEQLQAKSRSDFLAEASAVLSSSLDYQKTLSALARLAVPYLADWCAVDVIEDGELNRLTVAHIDPAKIEFVREIRSKLPTHLRAEGGPGRVLATGESELHAAVSDEQLQSGAVNLEHLEMLRKLEIRSALLVPLKARGQVLGVLTFVTAESGRRLNQSDRKLAEELASRAAIALDNARLFRALQQSEQKSRAMSEAAACAIYIHDETHFLYVNQAAEQLIGYTLGQFGDADIWQLVHPGDRAVVRERAMSQLQDGGGTLRQELRALRSDGSVVWLDVTSCPIDYAGRPALLATAFDVTARKFALEQLERRELEARTLLNSLPDYISRFDRKLRYLYISPHIDRAAPIPPSEYVGKTFRELGFPTHLAEQWEASLLRTFETAQPDNIEFSLSAPDGNMRHYLGIATPEITREGVVESVMTITRDITEQRNAAEGLRLSEAQLRLIIDSIPALVAYVDRNQVFRRVNRMFEQWFGDPVRSFIGRSISDVLGEENYAHVREQVQCALRGELMQFEVTNRYKDVTRHVLVTYVPDLDDDSQVRGFIALVMDVTERRKAEETLRKTEKLAAAGRLAASIAHEINNPLESITNLLFLLQNETGLSNSGRQYLALAEEELVRVAHIATQTLRFHRQSTRPVVTNLEELLDAVEALYQRRLSSSGVRFEKRYGHVRPIHALDGEVRQLLANLIGNALDASAAGGRIIVRTRDARTCDGHVGVQVTVADTGHGIAPELLARIFEPFVTTKGITGTGLGLWVSREIVKKHNGSMRVRSRSAGPRSGTVFTVFLADLAS